MTNKLYSNNPVPAKNRLILAKLSRNASGGFIDIQTASNILELNPTITTAKLARLAKMGWLKRVKRGLYYVLPLETNPSQPAITDDPWVLANEVFAPFYI